MTSSAQSLRERFIDAEWSIRPGFILGGLLAGAGALLLNLISRLPLFLSSMEAAQSATPKSFQVTSWLAIPVEQLYWPFHFLTETLNISGVDLRYVSVGFALASIMLIYAVFHTWFNRYYAALGTVLLICNSLFLSLALYATPASFVLFYVVASILATTLLYRGKGYGYLLGAITLALSFYAGIVGVVGGVCQLAVLLYVLVRKRLQRPGTGMTAGSVLLFLVTLAPAVYLAVQGHYGFMELPVFAVTHTFAVLELFTVGSLDNQLLLPETWPLLDIGSFSLLALGVAVSISRRKADRYKFLLVLFAIALFAVLAGGQYYPLLALLLVPMVVLITAGLRYLSDVWTDVFPKNKAAAIIAHSVTVSIVAVICLFHILRFTVLLPQLPEYKQAFEPQSAVDAVQ